MMIRHRVATLLVVLLLPRLASSQEVAGVDNPIPEGHFRVASVETDSGPDGVTIEAVIKAPDRSIFEINVRNPSGTRARNRTTIGPDPRNQLGEIRMTAALEREAGARFSYPMFSIHSVSSSSGARGGGSVALPPDQPLDELLTPILEAGDYPIGEAVEAFRFGDDQYMIRVDPAPPPRPLFVPIPVPMFQVFQPAGTFTHPGIPVGWIIPTPREELMRVIEQRVKDGTPIPPREIPFGFDLNDEDESGR